MFDWGGRVVYGKCGTFSQHNHVSVVAEEVAVDLRLDGVPAHTVGVQPLDIDLAVEVPHVADAKRLRSGFAQCFQTKLT